MRDYKIDLVDICASGPLSEIKNSSKYRNLCEQYNEPHPFHRFREKIGQIKQYLERTVEIQESERGQVTESLITICRVMADNDKEILKYCRMLIIKTYKKRWSPKQLAYFKKISDILTTRDHDYFLSFTRRKQSPDGYNPVNNNYEYFIKAILGKHQFTDKERIEKNLLAKSIHQILRDSGYNGFFYPEQTGDNQPVDQKVEHACKNTHIFIQLIQNVMFDKQKRVENYCFKEYNYVKDTFLEEQILFVLAEDSRERFISSPHVCLDYLDWYDNIKRNDIVILKFTTTWRQRDINLLKKEIEDKIGNKIKEYKDHLIENVP